ncbi:hypothetical protein ACTXT7_005216 [Hymenolepis weldensis]
MMCKGQFDRQTGQSGRDYGNGCAGREPTRLFGTSQFIFLSKNGLLMTYLNAYYINLLQNLQKAGIK